jgi:hypothetical protein
MAERSFESREEWVLMYRSGLTPAQISELCKVPVTFINRSLGSKRRQDPSLESDHKVNRPEAAEFKPLSRPTPRWLIRCDELLRFMSAHGHPPSAKASDPAEQALARWLDAQRSAAKNGNDPDRRRALDAAGNWRDSARAQRDDVRWHRRLQLLAEFKSNEDAGRRIGTATMRLRESSALGSTSRGRQPSTDECCQRSGNCSAMRCQAGTHGDEIPGLEAPGSIPLHIWRYGARAQQTKARMAWPLTSVAADNDVLYEGGQSHGRKRLDPLDSLQDANQQV